MSRDLRWYQPLPPPFKLVREVSFFLPGKSSRPQKSNWNKILVFFAGSCRITVPGWDAYNVGSGDILIIPGPCRHTYESPPNVNKGQDIHCLALFFHCHGDAEAEADLDSIDVAGLVRELFLQPKLLPGCFQMEIEKTINSIRSELDSRKSAFGIRIYALLLTFLVLLKRSGEAVNDLPIEDTQSREYLLNAVKEFIHKSIYSQIKLSDIAQQVNLSEEHLSRVFREETGQTVMTYLRNRRLEMAKQELIRTNNPVKYIARQFTFGNASHFCKLFRQATGCTPQQFRTAHHGREIPNP